MLTCCDGCRLGRRTKRDEGLQEGGRGADVLRWEEAGKADGARTCCDGVRVLGGGQGADVLQWGGGGCGVADTGRARTCCDGGRLGSRESECGGSQAVGLKQGESPKPLV